MEIHLKFSRCKKSIIERLVLAALAGCLVVMWSDTLGLLLTAVCPSSWTRLYTGPRFPGAICGTDIPPQLLLESREEDYRCAHSRALPQSVRAAYQIAPRLRPTR
jgi:hypothetical protein